MTLLQTSEARPILTESISPQRFVIKRDGSTQPIDLQKIRKIIQWACTGTDVNQYELESSLTLLLRSNIKTTEIQANLISNAKNKIGLDYPEWGLVAGRLLVSELRKDIALERGLDSLNPYQDFQGHVESFVNNNKYTNLLTTKYSSDELKLAGTFINGDLDLTYNYVALYVLKDRYLLPNELPQELFLCNALLLAQNEADDRMGLVKKYYDLLSTRKISLATPFLANLRIPNGSLTSCFILSLGDDLDELYGAFHKIARISKNGGGVGVCASNVRGMGATVAGFPNASGGVMPWIKIINDTAVAVNQVGRRKGAVTVALDIWHYDIPELLDCQTENGDLRKKTFDIFPQVVVNDVFMECVKVDDLWYLVDPYEVKSVLGIDLPPLWGDAFRSAYDIIKHAIRDGRITRYREVNAKKVFKTIMQSQLETGMPYLCFKDTINKANPNKHDGYIPSSNLCVAGETLILTEYGYLPIADVEGETLNVWNGSEWSEVLIKKTGEDQPLLKVNFSNGESLECTYYHHFWIQNEYKKKPERVEAKELKEGDKLIKYNLPIVQSDKDVDFPYAYTAGAFSGDGSYSGKGLPEIDLYGEKKELVSHLALRNKMWGNKSETKELDSVAVYDDVKQDRLVCKLPLDIAPKFTVPLNGFTVKSRLEWFAGLLDTDGCVCRNGKNESLSISSVNKPFLLNVRLMLQTLGVDSKVTVCREEGQRLMPDGKGGSKEYFCQKSYRLLISSNGLFQLSLLGLTTYRLKWEALKPQREATQFIKVVGIDLTCRRDDTYCFTEQKRNLGMFNGILTGQCVESYSNVSDEAIHCCNLLSLNLAQLVAVSDEELQDICYHAVRIIDTSIDLTSPPIEEATTHNNKYRTVGVGAMGLADWLAYNKKDYRNLDVIDNLFEDLSLYCTEASVKLAEEKGSYAKFEGSTWSQGLLMNARTLDDVLSSSQPKNRSRWIKLTEDIKTHGIRNSQIMAIAPNTSSSLIMEATASYLPAYKKFHESTNNLGSLPIAVPYAKDFLWFYRENQHIDQRLVVDVTATIQKWVDTGLSMELLFNLNENAYDFQEKDGEKIGANHIFETLLRAWEQGCKTVYYIRAAKKKSKEVDRLECSSCSN